MLHTPQVGVTPGGVTPTVYPATPARAPHRPRRPRRWWIGLLLVAVPATALDLLSKWIVTAGDHFHLHNDAHLLGIGGGTPLNTALISLTVSTLYTVYASTTRPRHRYWAAGLVIAGGTANAIDRLLHGAVIDFLPLPGDLYVNLADIIVALGLAASIRIGRPTPRTWRERR